MDIKKSSALTDYARQVFLASKVHLQRENSRKEVYSQLQKMKKSIIGMNLRHSDIDRLRQKIDMLIDWERKYARLFRPSDSGTADLKSHITMLEEELKKEREEKHMIISERDEKVAELTDSITRIKNSMKHLMLEKAKRSHRLTVLSKKIDDDVDRSGYYNS